MKHPAPKRLVSALALLLAGCTVAPTRLPAPLPVTKASADENAETSLTA